jgi:hypothetical protein
MAEGATSAETMRAGQSVKTEGRPGVEKANTGAVGPEVPRKVSHQLALRYERPMRKPYMIYYAVLQLIVDLNLWIDTIQKLIS